MEFSSSAKNIMESPSRKSPQKDVKVRIPSCAKGVVRHVSPSLASINNSGKAVMKESSTPKFIDFKLHTQQRALKRALFNYSVATKIYMIEQERKELLKLQKMMEEEEVKLMRKEMIPRAQLMPYFDRPFFPHRSNRALTIPKEPNLLSGKCSSCVSCRVHFPILTQ